MTELHGITGAPYKTPQVRKVHPAPHSRHRIDMDGGSRVKRSWKDTPVAEIQPGDLVANVGMIRMISEFLSIPELGPDDDPDDDPDEVPGVPVWTFRLHNALQEFWDFPGHQRVYAFTPDVVTGE